MALGGTPASPTLPVWGDGDMLYAAQLNVLSGHLAALYGIACGGFRTQKPLLVIAGSTTSSATGADTVLSWPTETVDTDGMFSPGGTTVTIQTAGWYRMLLQVHYGTASGGTRRARIMVNGTNPATNSVASDARTPVTSGGDGTTLFCQAEVQLAAGATVTAGVTQTSGGTVAVTTAFSGCFLSLEYVSPYAG